MSVMCLYRELNVDVIEYHVGTVVVGSVRTCTAPLRPYASVD